MKDCNLQDLQRAFARRVFLVVLLGCVWKQKSVTPLLTTKSIEYPLLTRLETERMPSSFSSSFTCMATALNRSLLPSSGSLDQKHFLYLLTFIAHKKNQLLQFPPQSVFLSHVRLLYETSPTWRNYDVTL